MIKHSPLYKYWSWLALAAIIIFVAAIRIRLLQIPLERDEGEFAYMGQLLLQGIPPYLTAYSMKLPGIYAAYALVMAIFGQTIAGIHIGLMLVNTVAIVLVFLLTRRLSDDIAGAVAAAGYGLLSLSPSVLGTSAHATQFIVPLALGGTLLMLKSLDSGKCWMLFASGLLYGLAFIMKQHAVFFIMFAVIYFIGRILKTKPIDWKKLAGKTTLLVLASAIPIAVCCILLYSAGAFSKFWFWTFSYAQQYVAQNTLADAPQLFMSSAPKIITSWGWFWAIAGIGLTAIFWNEKAKSHRLFILGFSTFSFLTICPGFFFREHYFVTLLPAIALLAGVAVSAMIQFLAQKKTPILSKSLPLLIIAATLIFPIIKLNSFFFRAEPAEASRMMYGANPFPESVEIADYIKRHSSRDDKIVVMGSEPQIYFYADRKSATGYIYVYGLMEVQAYASRMQRQMIQEIETARPAYAVFINVPTSWLRKEKADMTIVDWLQTYLDTNYRIVGIIDIFNTDYSAHWDESVRSYRPASDTNVYVMERISRDAQAKTPAYKR
ncbi:MAG: glycosyltransferase family 39 protein [Syntrophales bacterium]